MNSVHIFPRPLSCVLINLSKPLETYVQYFLQILFRNKSHGNVCLREVGQGNLKTEHSVAVFLFAFRPNKCMNLFEAKISQKCKHDLLSNSVGPNWPYLFILFKSPSISLVCSKLFV